MGRTSKPEPGERIDIENSNFPTPSMDNPPMSGADIRSLVKQLTSSTRTTKDQMAMSSLDPESGDGDNPASRNFTQYSDETQQQQQSKSGPPPPPHKKQVRRRLHTTRPYQERLLNMAEARREIVAALKFHRAAMKQAQEQQQEEEKHQKQPPPPIPNPLHQPPNYMNYQFDTSSIPLPPFPYPSPHNLGLSLSQNPFSWPVSQISPLIESSTDNLTLVLPNQTLGLNLNLHDFDNLIYHNGSTNPPSISSTSSPPCSSSSSSSSSSALTTVSHEVGPGAEPGKVTAAVATEEGRRDNEEMAEEMRSIGERHQMEWNDRMNLVTSAWWFEFLKGVEADDEEVVKRAAEEYCSGGGGFQVFDEVMEFPPWLGSGESCLQQHLVDDCFSDDYLLQDASLACMDIGEIEGIDGEWLSS
ncbi:hypothetical protein CDL15_Pgr003927 [Punica granatum]|nr:hypothetical protein CDL15_Pgr003927 [Punica granatum]